jgi:hypothetical protein
MSFELLSSSGRLFPNFGTATCPPNAIITKVLMFFLPSLVKSPGSKQAPSNPLVVIHQYLCHDDPAYRPPKQQWPLSLALATAMFHIFPQVLHVLLESLANTTPVTCLVSGGSAVL